LNSLQNIEKKYPVGYIKYKNENIWGFLRLKYYWNMLEPITSVKKEKKKESFFKKIIKNSFYGFRHWFNNYDYIFFSDTQERTLIAGQYIDKSFEFIIDSLDQDKCLYVDLPNPKHFKQSSIPTKHIVSRRLIDLFISIAIKITKRKRIDLTLLDRINEENNININYKKIIHSFEISVLVYSLLLRIYKPKAIFISCYYCNQAVIKAANNLNILTIESQHGIIDKSHDAYYPNVAVDKSFFPDILLTFGVYDKNLISQNPFNPFDTIIPIGRYNLELLSKSSIARDLLLLTRKYIKIVSISTQYTIEDELARFVKKLALMDPNIGFIFSLRHYEKEYYCKYQMPSNVYLFKDEYNCYDILRCSDIHMTCYSSCALEALFFNKPVCLVDINGLASKYVKIKSKNIYKILTPKDFFRINFKYEQEKIELYIRDHKIKVKKLLKEVLHVK